MFNKIVMQIKYRYFSNDIVINCVGKPLTFSNCFDRHKNLNFISIINQGHLTLKFQTVPVVPSQLGSTSTRISSDLPLRVTF